MTIRFEVKAAGQIEHLTTREADLPDVGDVVVGDGGEIYKVIDIIHTPLIRRWDALVTVEALKPAVGDLEQSV